MSDIYAGNTTVGIYVGSEKISGESGTLQRYDTPAQTYITATGGGKIQSVVKTYDITNVPNYVDLTVDNISFASISQTGNICIPNTPTFTYNASTGIITVTGYATYASAEAKSTMSIALRVTYIA